MSLNQYGRYEALLDGPMPHQGNGKDRFAKLYEDYVELYLSFYALSTTFRPELIPKTRLVKMPDGSIEERAYIPFYQQIQIDPTLDAIQKNEEEQKIARLQEATVKRWGKLERVMDELCNHEYVHALSPYTKVTQSYQYKGHGTLKNIDVTDIPYIAAPWDIVSQQVERDPRTVGWYRNVLMMVILQNK